MKMTIKAVKNDHGKYVLAGVNPLTGETEYPRGNYEYDNSTSAMADAALLYPCDSIWHGRRSEDGEGWEIDVTPDSIELEQQHEAAIMAGPPATLAELADHLSAWELDCPNLPQTSKIVRYEDAEGSYLYLWIDEYENRDLLLVPVDGPNIHYRIDHSDEDNKEIQRLLDAFTG